MDISMEKYLVEKQHVSPTNVFKHELSELKFLHQVQRKQQTHTKIVTRGYGDKNHQVTKQYDDVNNDVIKDNGQ